MYSTEQYNHILAHLAANSGTWALSADRIGLDLDIPAPALHPALAALVANGEVTVQPDPFGGNPLYRLAM